MSKVQDQFKTVEFWLEQIPDEPDFGHATEVYDDYQVEWTRHPAGPNQWGGGEYYTSLVQYKGKELTRNNGDLSREDLAGTLAFFFQSPSRESDG